jgi:hypothetical protein
MVKRYGWAALLAAGICVWFYLASLPPHYSRFTTTRSLEDAGLLAFGAIFTLAQILIDMSPLLLVVVFAALMAFFVVIARLARQRRWPTLLPIAVLLLVNWLIFGAFGFVRQPKVADPIESCEFYVDPRTSVRMIRYPIDVGAEIGEQQFFLVTTNNGDDWEQIAETYVLGLYPTDMPCSDNIERTDEDRLILQFGRKSGPNQNRTITYVSDDLGRSWQRVESDTDDD